MAAIDIMGKISDRGFRLRVQYALFSVAKDKADPAPTADDLAYVNAILVGEAALSPVYIAVLVINASAATDTDVIIKGNIETLWPFLARAWVARTV